ncbi:hypothetical protein GCM10023074_30530 [Microbispora amethystogenes]|uniref:Uncharacterized protein n=1 Tax=Microbispora amethystogenes TaxID=1427754 RepID=A0ABQ4FLG3_9ACTN|nr:hypothetical protein Mam01_57970 [Microbispora amethystogenes]
MRGSTPGARALLTARSRCSTEIRAGFTKDGKSGVLRAADAGPAADSLAAATTAAPMNSGAVRT